MAQVQISQLPTASTLTGYELVPIVQNGVTSQTTTGAISPASGASLTFLTLTNQPTLTSSRNLVVSTGLLGVDGGPQNPYTISLANTGVTAGTYTFPTIVVNAQGQITSVSSNPTEISTISFGSTGLTPNTPTSGAITVAGTLNVASGGTGLTTLATGALVYGAATSAFVPLPIGSAGQVLTVNSGGTAPQWSTLSSSAVTTISFGTTGLTPSSATSGAVTVAGTLAVGNGGTGLTTLTAGYIPYGAGTSSLASVSTFNYNTTNNTLNTPTFGTTSTTSTTPSLSFNAANTSFASGATVASSYLQALMQNKSGTSGASTNYVLSNDLGTDSSYYGEFGMNSSGYTASGSFADFFSIYNGVYFSAHDGDVSVGSGNGYKTYLTWGTTGQSAHSINASGAIGLSTNLGTSSATTGTTGYGTAGQVLTSQGSSAAPTWTTPTTGTVTSVAVSGGTTGLTTSGGPITGSGTITLSGTLAIANGGTGSTTLAGANIALFNTSQTWTATQTFNGTSSTEAVKVLNIAEPANVVGTAPTSTTNFYVNSGAVQYYTANNANNWTLNFAFSSGTSLNTAMSVGDSISCTMIVTNSTTAYYPSAFTIDGTSVTPKWQGGTAPTSGDASALDSYTFVIIKTASATYTVLATQTKFA